MPFHRINDPDREGWLWKEGKFGRNWVKRCFRLVGEKLEYRQFSDDPEPLGVIPMTRALAVFECSAPDSAPKPASKKEWRYYFYVETALRKYVLASSSFSDRAHWLEDLRLAMVYGDKTAEEMHWDLFQALENSNFRAVRNVLKRSQVHINVVQNFRTQYNPLHLSVIYMDPELMLPVARLLVKSGTNTNSVDAKGNLPSHLLLRSSIPSGRIPPILDVLLDKDSDINMQNDRGNSLLHIACLREYKGLERDFEDIPYSSRPDRSAVSDGISKAPPNRSIAAQIIVLKVLRKLLSYDFDSSLVNKDGLTPLACAVVRGNMVATRFLIDRGFGSGEDNLVVQHERSDDESSTDIEIRNLAGAHVNFPDDFNLRTISMVQFAKYAGYRNIERVLLTWSQGSSRSNGE